MTRRLLFIRHGESESNRLGLISNCRDRYHLLEEGKEQINFISEHIHNFGLKVVYTSPYARARESAEIISSNLDIPIIADERLRETDYGQLNNTVMVGRVIDMDPEMARERGVESLESHRLRTDSFMSGCPDRSAIVTHGLVVRAAVSIITGIGQDEMGGIHIRPGSMTLLDADLKKVYSIGNFLVSGRMQKTFSLD